jgi:hypothetical protein
MTNVRTDKRRFQGPDDLTDRSNPAVPYALSLLPIRATVGIIGIPLPLILMIGEVFLLRGGVQVRGSISAYYHTSMRDLFVTGPCVIGFLLARCRRWAAGRPDQHEDRHNSDH